VKVTMADIANRLGISKNSVSIALCGKKGISDALRAKIIETAHQMKYGALPTQAKGKYIITIIPEYLRNDAFFYADVLSAIEQEAHLQDYIAIHHNVSKESEETLIMPQYPVDMQIAGLLVVGVLSEEYISALCNLSLPIISVDIEYHRSSIGYVGTANITGSTRAVEYLISQNHKEIGFVGAIHAAQSVYERWCGFRQALLQNNLEYHSEYCIVGQPGSPVLFDTPEALESWLDAITKYPTAWFCSGDCVAVSMINCLTKRGISVPDDISVIGYDNLVFSEMFYPRLTTMAVDRKRMGRLAVRYLLGQYFENCLDTNIELKSELVIRDSVKQLT